MNIKRHMPTHDKLKKPTQCDKCDFTSKYSTTLERHMNSGKHKGGPKSNEYRKILMNKIKNFIKGKL